MYTQNTLNILAYVFEGVFLIERYVIKPSLLIATV